MMLMNSGITNKEENTSNKKQKKACNCPNCGAPVMNYICEYCGTELEKPKKVLSDQEARESFVKLVRQQQQAQLQASQIAQTQQIINSLNAYSSQTQIMNIRDSIDSSMIQAQSYIYQDSMSPYQTQIIASPYQGPKVQETEQKANKSSRCLNIFAISFLFLFILSLVYIALHFLV